MSEQQEARAAALKEVPASQKGSAAQAAGAGAGQRARFEALSHEHMPKDFKISLDAYRKGGTDRFIGRAPADVAQQPMKGFEPTYVNIIDYIVRITHRIWEEKDIGYIYDTYSHDCTVWDDLGLQYGRDKIVADTVHTNGAFPDIRLVADEVVWAGNETVGFHTSHRTKILGTNTGFSRFGSPTGKRIQLWCMANCVARENEIFHEHVLYDTAGLVQQLGFDVQETAARMADLRIAAPQLTNFLAAEPKRLSGQGKPETIAIPDNPSDDPDAFIRAAFHTIWNRRNFGAIDQVYAPNAVSQLTAGRVYRGTGQLRSFALSLVAMFPDLNLTIDDVYWMGNPTEGYVASIRWSAQGTHRGNGIYGEPTGKQINLWGITQWAIEGGRVVKEWAMFNEFGIMMQLAS